MSLGSTEIGCSMNYRISLRLIRVGRRREPTHFDLRIQTPHLMVSNEENWSTRGSCGYWFHAWRDLPSHSVCAEEDCAKKYFRMWRISRNLWINFRRVYVGFLFLPSRCSKTFLISLLASSLERSTSSDLYQPSFSFSLKDLFSEWL